MPALRPGDVFAGDFTIVKELAEGGMGTVYVAEQASTGRRRALKLLRSEFSKDARTRERFEQEARVASRIASEHIVEVVSAGIDQTTDTPWIAMELLEGKDLAGYQRERGLLAGPEARQILGQIGHALAAAHRAGVVHRDLKPENVFVATTHQRDRNLVVKVLDFGIAKIVAEARAAQNDTAAVGTPRWMAPEQADSTARVSPATDVWAFGLLAFWLLTGESYWKSAKGIGGVMGMMREVLFNPLPPASSRAAELGSSVSLPPGFDVWFARATMRDPLQRFPDAAAAGDALDAVLAGPRHASGPPPPFGVSGGAPPIALPKTLVGAPNQLRLPALAQLPRWQIAAAAAGILGALLFFGLGIVWLASDGGAPGPRSWKSDAEIGDLSGTWSIASSMRPGNSGRYDGTATLSRIFDNYRINWALKGGAGYEGIAIVDGHTLNVAWSNVSGYQLYLVRGESGRLKARIFGNDARQSGSEELEGPPGFAGTYAIKGASGGYTGRMIVTPHGESATVLWTTTKGIWTGVALKTREGWVIAAMQNFRAGVVAYDIASGRKLVGRWAVMGDARIGMETLVRK